MNVRPLTLVYACLRVGEAEATFYRAFCALTTPRHSGDTMAIVVVTREYPGLISC